MTSFTIAHHDTAKLRFNAESADYVWLIRQLFYPYHTACTAKQRIKLCVDCTHLYMILYDMIVANGQKSQPNIPGTHPADAHL